jgi:hypothetical protein
MPAHHLRYALAGVLVMLAVGTLGYHVLEGWGWVQSFYFATVSLTTVGYGDLHPTSDASRLFTAGYLLVGISIVLFTLTSLGAHLVTSEEHLAHRVAKRVKNRGRRK